MASRESDDEILASSLVLVNVACVCVCVVHFSENLVSCRPLRRHLYSAVRQYFLICAVGQPSSRLYINLLLCLRLRRFYKYWPRTTSPFDILMTGPFCLLILLRFITYASRRIMCIVFHIERRTIGCDPVCGRHALISCRLSSFEQMVQLLAAYIYMIRQCHCKVGFYVNCKSAFVRRLSSRRLSKSIVPGSHLHAFRSTFRH